jgi:hypothetical protein
MTRLAAGLAHGEIIGGTEPHGAEDREGALLSLIDRHLPGIGELLVRRQHAGRRRHQLLQAVHAGRVGAFTLQPDQRGGQRRAADREQAHQQVKAAPDAELQPFLPAHIRKIP